MLEDDVLELDELELLEDDVLDEDVLDELEEDVLVDVELVVGVDELVDVELVVEVVPPPEPPDPLSQNQEASPTQVLSHELLQQYES